MVVPTTYSYDTSGNMLNSFATPGGSANDVDIEIAPVQFLMNGNTIQEGQVLFVNGESGSAEIYAVDNGTGIITDTLATTFGTDHVVGGSYHHQRNTFFMVQDNVPGVALENLIAEIDPSNGDTLDIFQITPYFNVSYGDIEVGDNGNLFVVSSAEDSIAEFTATGTFVQMHDLPVGVADLSGIALDCASGEAWVCNTSGTIFHLGNFPCETTSVKENTSNALLEDIYPNPFTDELRFSVVMKKASETKISIINAAGEEISIIYSSLLDAGRKDFAFKKDDLLPGIYLLKISGNDFTSCKKILCIK
jgi:hypothetical protein